MILKPTACFRERHARPGTCKLTPISSFMLKRIFPPLFAAGLVFCGEGALLRAAPSQEQLIATIQSSAPLQEKWAAARQLAGVANANVVPALAKLLPDDQLSDLARYVLEPLPSPAVDTALRRALPIARGRPLAGVICSLGARRDAKAVLDLVKHLGDTDMTVVSATAAALGRIGTLQAAKAFEIRIFTVPKPVQMQFWAGLVQCAERLREQDHETAASAIFHWIIAANAPVWIHEAAVRGVILTGEKNTLKLLAQYLPTDTSAVLRLAQSELPGAAATRVLIAEMPKLAPDQRVLLIEALGQRGDAESPIALIGLARNGDKPARLAAIRFVPHSVSLAPVLVDLVSDPDKEIAEAACERLASLPEPEADTAILRLLDSQPPALKRAAAEMAGRRRLHSAKPALEAAAESSDSTLAGAALIALDEIEDQSAAAQTQLPDYPFFPFCIDWHDAKKRNYVQQAAMLKELGYEGVGHIYLDGVAERLKSLDAAGLKLFQITMTVNLTPGKTPYDPRFKDVLALVKGRHVQFDLLVSGGPASDVSLDPRAVTIIRQMSDMARDSGAQLLLYPHAGLWVERIEDAVRMADKVNCPNVGVMFNLCHWLRTERQRDYKSALSQAMPRLWAVSICGADDFDPSPGWARYIQPLDKGSFNVGLFLKTLKDLGYKGPIGLQCYGIGGDAREHLARSFSAWQRLRENLKGAVN